MSKYSEQYRLASGWLLLFVSSSVPCKREVVVVYGGVEAVVVDEARDDPTDFCHGIAVIELRDHLVDVHAPVSGGP